MYTVPIFIFLFIKSIVLNGVFHEQELLIIVVSVVLHSQLDCNLVFRKWKHQTCIIFECLSVVDLEEQ